MLKIDEKFHLEDETIVKTSNGEVLNPGTEPLIVFRSRDKLALPMLDYYRYLCVQDGCTDYQLEVLDRRIAMFRKFKENNPDKMKQPGVTKGM
jgi:hypothetical protein